MHKLAEDEEVERPKYGHLAVDFMLHSGSMEGLMNEAGIDADGIVESVRSLP